MNYKEFEKKYLGKAVDFDGVAGVQCVDLVDKYLEECFGITGVWVQGARELYTQFEKLPYLRDKFTKIPNTRDLVVQAGDIVVWGGGSWGHTGIGTGEGDRDYFVCIEENTLGLHEKTQKITHHFSGGHPHDSCNPVLGVLRPKPDGKKTLDTVGFKRGDKTLGVYYLKRYLSAVCGFKLDDNATFGEGTEKAVNAMLKSKAYTENGIAGEGFARVFIK